MHVPTALVPLFSNSSRARGEDYAHANRVRLTSITPTLIEAIVRGGGMYQVRLACESGPNATEYDLEVACTCPYFEGGSDTCKHIWATIIAASRQPNTFLTRFESATRGAISLVPVLDPNASLDLDEELDVVNGFRPGTARAAQHAPAQKRSPGRQFLNEVTRTIATAAVNSMPFRYMADQLIYVLDLSQIGRGGGMQFEVLSRDRKKDGSWRVPQRAVITPLELQSAPPEDAEILTTLLGASYASGTYGAYSLPTTFPLLTQLARVVIPKIAKTGRAYVRRETRADDELMSVTWDDGPPWRFEFETSPLESGVRLSGQFARGDERLGTDTRVTALESGFLITPTTIARVVLPTSRALFASLLRSGPIALSADEVTSLAELLAKTESSGAELPPALRVAEIDVEPRRRLSLRPLRAIYPRDQLEGAASFDYDGSIVDADSPASAWDPAKKRRVRRRPDDEAAALARLDELGVLRRVHPYARRPMRLLSPKAMPAVVRALVAEGWLVEAEGRLIQRPSNVAMSVSSGIDWFNLTANVEFSGETVPLTDILAALKRGESTVTLGDGSMGLLPETWLERYAPLAALGEAQDGRLRFRLPQTALLDALLAAQADEAAVTVDAKFDAARQQLARFDRIAPADPPASFHGALRPYQKDGLGWLGFLRQFGFGGCLADDMGLGKTVMVLAMLDAWRRDRPAGTEVRPSLVVAPRSVVHNWIAEAARFTPELRVRDCSHAGRKAAAGLWDDVDVGLATFGTLRRDIAEIKDREFDYVILDEAQSIKNADTASAKAARLLRGRHRLALSGTPIENHLGELWSLFEFLNPGLLGRSSVFAGVGSSTRTVEPETAQLLSRGLRPFILRRTKAQVATDLPPKTEQTIVCELEGKQKTFYNSLRAHYRDALLGRIDRMGLKKSKLQVLEALLRLRQAACHPGLIDAAHAKTPSAKLDVLVPRLREVVNEGHKAIVFSQFTSFLALVQEALAKEEIVYEYLDGQTRDREARVSRFQTDPDCPVFLVSLKAGGLGLNLTAAEYVFLLDPWWNPAVEAQAIDRAHRIGQTEHVFAYRLIARDTVEEKVLELQQTKRSLADAILRADAGLIGQLGREDLEMLLS